MPIDPFFYVFVKITNFRPYCKPSNKTFLCLNSLRVSLHRQNKMNAKKIITLALTVAILPYGVWF